jgi:hypothetical protein
VEVVRAWPFGGSERAFSTPTRSIVCAGEDGFVWCRASGLKPKHEPIDCGGSDQQPRDTIELGPVSNGHRAGCNPDDGPFMGVPRAKDGTYKTRILAYGTTWRHKGIVCTSARSGLTCRNPSGHGFFFSHRSWRPV